MQIIGETKEGYIVTIDSNEMEEIQGLFDNTKVRDRLKIGDKINLWSGYSAVKLILTGRLKGELLNAYKLAEDAKNHLDFLYSYAFGLKKEVNEKFPFDNFNKDK